MFGVPDERARLNHQLSFDVDAATFRADCARLARGEHVQRPARTVQNIGPPPEPTPVPEDVETLAEVLGVPVSFVRWWAGR